MDAEELGMQQALLRKGSNRNTAVGGLKEAISRRCACASQSIEEGGGGNTGNQLGREGRGYTSQSRKRSVRGSRVTLQAADTDDSAHATSTGDQQRRTHPNWQQCSSGGGEVGDVVMMAQDPADCTDMSQDGLRARDSPPQSARAVTRDGECGSTRSDGQLSHRLEVAAGDLTGDCSRRSSPEAGDEAEADQEEDSGGVSLMHASQRVEQRVQACLDAGGEAVMALTAEAQQSVKAAFLHAEQMVATVTLISTLTAEFAAAGECKSAAALLEVRDAVATMACASFAAANQAAESEAGSGQMAMELAVRLAEVAQTLVSDIADVNSQLESAAAITIAAKRQKRATSTAGVIDELEPEWLRAAQAELDAVTGRPEPAQRSMDVRAANATADERKRVKKLMKKLKEIDELEVKESIGAELNADQQMKVAARGGVEAEIERWGGSQDLEQLALAQRKREARERLDAREAEEAGCFQTRGLSVHAALCVKAMRTRVARAQERNAAAMRIQAVSRGFCSRRGGEGQGLAHPSPTITDGATAPLSLRSGGRQRRAMRLARQRGDWQHQRAGLEYAQRG